MISIMYREISEQTETLDSVKTHYEKNAKGLLEELKNYKKVYLMGTGASHQACLSALPAFLIHTDLDISVVGACDNTRISRITKDDIVILVSQSGNSLETKVAVDSLEDKGIDIWALCNDSTSYLWNKAKIKLPILAPNETGSATKSYAGSVLALHYIACAGKKELLTGIIEDNKKTLIEIPQKAKDYALNLKGDVLYLVGLEDSYPVTGQASIVLKEKAYLHVQGMSLTEFRHGTVEVVSEELPIILVAIGKQAYKDAEHHKDYLVGIGANCIILADQDGADVKFTNNLHPEFGLINAQVFFQYLAEAIAVERNLDVDEFKFLSKVVDKY